MSISRSVIQLSGSRGGPPKKLVEFPVRHAQAVVVGEVLHVQLEAAVLAQVDHLAHDPLEVTGLPYGASPITLYSALLTLKPR